MIRGCSADETDGAKKMKRMVQKQMENLVITTNDNKFINHNNSHFVTQFNGKLLNGVIKKDPFLIILDGSMHIKVASVCW
jgi:hypothetical protein